MSFSRRNFLTMAFALPGPFIAGAANAVSRQIWSASAAHDALQADQIRLIDIRTPEEWRETGVAEGAWPLNLYDPRFPERLFQARELADGRPVALICRTGNRTGRVIESLMAAGYTDFIDVSEGMIGSSAGIGWIKTGLPLVTADVAVAQLPSELTL